MGKEEDIMQGFRNVLNKIVYLNKFKMEESLNGYKSSEVHCIEYIGVNEDPNVTKLAEAFYMTRCAITKITQKLMKKGIIESYQKSENKKEIYFRLTEQGKTVYEIHESLHKAFQERDKIVFEQLTEEQINTIIDFTEKYVRHLDTEIKNQELAIKPE